MQTENLIRCPDCGSGRGLCSLQAEVENWLDVSQSILCQEQLEVAQLNDYED